MLTGARLWFLPAEAKKSKNRGLSRSNLSYSSQNSWPENTPLNIKHHQLVYQGSPISQRFAGETFDQFRSNPKSSPKPSECSDFCTAQPITKRYVWTLIIGILNTENPNLSCWDLGAQIDPYASPDFLVSIHKNGRYQIWVFLRSICGALLDAQSVRDARCSFLKSHHLRRSFANQLDLKHLTVNQFSNWWICLNKESNQKSNQRFLNKPSNWVFKRLKWRYCQHMHIRHKRMCPFKCMCLLVRIFVDPLTSW